MCPRLHEAALYMTNRSILAILENLDLHRKEIIIIIIIIKSIDVGPMQFIPYIIVET